jgi:drug/metabolite transporter (DMT)-like permease
LILALAGITIVAISDTCTWQNSSLVCPPLNEFMQGKAFLGDLLALAGALAGACYITIGRRLRSGISVVSYIFIVYGMAAVVLVLVMLVAGYTPWGYPPISYVWFALLALVPQLLGHSTFNWALGYLSAAFVSLTLLGEPIGSTILAYFLLDETPSILKMIGAILILAGILIASRSERAAQAPPLPPSA